MSFLYPWVLSLILPIVIFLLKKKKKNLAQNMLWIALVFLTIALSRPVIKESNQKEEYNIGSIILALDVSASMRANDIKPNRLLASKETIKVFLKNIKKEQVSLIAFSSNPLLLSPLSRDYNLLISSLEALNEKYILTKGTNLKKLIKKVAKFPLNQKLLVIFSDGGDEVIDNKIIDFIKENNIKILIVAMATQKGSPILIDDKLLKDKKGHIVISNLNTQIYKLGEVITFTNPQSTALEIKSWVKREILKDVTKKHNIKYFELFFIPAFLGLVLIFLSETKFISKFIALLLLFGIDANATILDGYYLNRAYVLYKSGEYNSSLEKLSKIEEKTLESEIIKSNDYYRLKEYKKAKGILLSIKTTNPKIKQQLLYNLGNCEAKLSYFQKAIEYYILALNIKEDKDILYNLEIVIFLKNKLDSKIAGMLKPQSQGEGGDLSDIKKNIQNKKKSADKNSKQNSAGGESKTAQSSINTDKSINKTTHSKRKFSSKAYDLINKGYINEDKPW